MNRKKRSDRNHLIYEIINTENGKRYIGVTACIGRAFNYSALRRFQKHMSRAKCENKDWALYKDMKKYGPDVYDVYVKDVLRGKAEAHKLETFYLQNFVYELNSTH
jgi:predicted GNAT family acetyltransferase